MSFFSGLSGNGSTAYAPGGANSASAPGLPPTTNRRAIEREVELGLPNEQARLGDCIQNVAFYNRDAIGYMPKRDTQNYFDAYFLAKLESGITRTLVDILCEHQYNPGPSRMVDGDAAADEFMQVVYEKNHINALMQRAEVHATLNDYAAVQVIATNDPESPIRLRLWGADEFHVFIDPDDPLKPLACVTIDRVDQQTRYRLWTDDEVVTFVTKQFSSWLTAGGRVATEVARETNTYGCLPFAFVHDHVPVRNFLTPGPGDFMRRAESNISGRLSRLEETIEKYGNPVGVFKNVSPEFNPVIEPGRFMRLPGSKLGPYGDQIATGEPSAEYLQASIDIAGTWEHISRYVDMILEATRVPRAAVRMEQTGVASGISLIVEQAPLLTRARQRHADFALYETELARCTLRCAGNHYDRPELVSRSDDLQLLLAWPEPSIPIPGPERDAADQAELSLGIKSRIQIVMERRGLTRDQALAYLDQVAEDEQVMQKLFPEETEEGERTEGEGADEEGDEEPGEPEKPKEKGT